MSAPRTKRQFAGAASDPAQRQIKDFFKPTPTSGSSTSNTTYTSRPLSPPLPGVVQANLLSVGMRVRKSVPEGYKTGDKCSGFSLWSDNSVPSGQQESSSSLNDFSLPIFTPPQSSSSIPSFSSTGRELLPFCGINKVGGLAVQPDAAAPISASFFTSSTTALDQPTISLTPAAATAVPELDDVPGLTSSQDSVLSVSSSPPAQPRNNKKRFYTAEDTDTAAATTLAIPIAENGGGITWRNRRDWLDGEVSPRSLAPVGWEKNARVMAVPRGVMRKAAAAAGAGTSAQDGGQENRVVGVSVVDDFEDAEFLEDYMEVEE